MSQPNFISVSEFRKIRDQLSNGNSKPKTTYTRGEESKMQEACVEWFRFQFPQYKTLLFSVPNGGFRSVQSGKKMKAEGMMRGVSDLLLLVPRGNWHGLAIEFKTSSGRLSAHQEEWGTLVLEQGYPYLVIRSKENFMERIIEYLNL
jgi:hypothetical protein